MKDEIPKRLHYQNNDRIAPILVVMDDGWYMVDRQNDTVHLSELFDDSILNFLFYFFFLPAQRGTPLSIDLPCCT